MLTVYEGVVVKHLEDSPAHVLALTLALTDTTSRQGSLYRTQRKATFCQKLLSGDPQETHRDTVFHGHHSGTQILQITRC